MATHTGQSLLEYTLSKSKKSCLSGSDFPTECCRPPYNSYCASQVEFRRGCEGPLSGGLRRPSARGSTMIIKCVKGRGDDLVQDQQEEK